MSWVSLSERQFHRLRWVLTVAWLLLIASLVVDPISPYLTGAQTGIPGLQVDPGRCVPVQGQCVALGADHYYFDLVDLWA
jgi:hypothetical protein